MQKRDSSGESGEHEFIINIGMLGVVRLMRRFSDMKYYKEIASFLKMKVPVLNEEISIKQDVVCVVHGIKKLEQTPLPLLETLQSDTPPQDKPANSTPTQQTSSPTDPLYIYERHSQQVLPFHKAMALSKSLNMDLNLMREGGSGIYPILTLSTFRKHVYSEYFMAHVKRRGKEGWKSIRLGERIEDNDIRTKVDNINRMVRAGQRRFRLVAVNDSDRSQKVIVQFGKLLGQEVEPYIQTVTNAARKKEDRWVGDLIFDQEVAFNVEQVNKKWRRRQFEEKQPKGHSPQQLRQLFEDDDVRMERELYHAYKDLDIKMPPKFEKMAQDQRNLQNDRFALFRSAEEEQQQQEQEWDEQEEQKFKQKMGRYNKQFFKERTASEIIDEMETLKRSGYQSEAHKVARFKQLKEELQAIIKKHHTPDL